jgi:hypothetical protein
VARFQKNEHTPLVNLANPVYEKGKALQARRAGAERGAFALPNWQRAGLLVHPSAFILFFFKKPPPS